MLALGPYAESLLAELEKLNVESERHLLKVAGYLCLEAGQPDLWRRMISILNTTNCGPREANHYTDDRSPIRCQSHQYGSAQKGSSSLPWRAGCQRRLPRAEAR
jgi:hypothetical protein